MHLNKASLRRWIAAGKVDGRRIGGRWFVLGAEILRLLQGEPTATLVVTNRKQVAAAQRQLESL